MKIPLSVLSAALVLAPLGAQIDPGQLDPGQADPARRMREIMNEVARELTQVDVLLQKSSRSRQADSAGMKRSIDGLEKALDAAGKSQRQVVQGIDALLEQAQKLKQAGC